MKTGFLNNPDDVHRIKHHCGEGLTMRVMFPGPVKPLSPREYAAVKQWVKDFDAHAEKIRATLKKESK